MNFKNRVQLAFNVLSSRNKFYEAFYKMYGTNYTSYDVNGATYINEGYNKNPIVYSVINQISTKAASIPFNIKKVEDESQKNKRDNLIKASNYNLSFQQELKKIKYEKNAFSDEFVEIPIERPNPTQTWTEFISLYETFLSATGNVYIYLLSPEDGSNKGTPIAWYLLPSHLMEIRLKDNIDLMGTESPVDGYSLIEGNQQILFEAENVVHIKYSNPNYDLSGSQLYGQSDLRACLRNIESSNEFINLNLKTSKNAGVFGIIHGKSTTTSPSGLMTNQATGIKDKIKESDISTERMSNILVASQELGFQKMSLNTSELQPFEYLKYDTQMICAALGWDDKLLGNDSSAKYDNYNLAIKRGITSKIMPDLKLLEQAINSKILPRYKGYEKTVFEFDYSEVPELQKDMAELIGWSKELIDRGAMTRNQFRDLAKLQRSDDPNLDKYTVSTDIMTLEQSLDDFPSVTND